MFNLFNYNIAFTFYLIFVINVDRMVSNKCMDSVSYCGDGAGSHEAQCQVGPASHDYLRRGLIKQRNILFLVTRSIELVSYELYLSN